MQIICPAKNAQPGAADIIRAAKTVLHTDIAVMVMIILMFMFMFMFMAVVARQIYIAIRQLAGR
ncbi:hypothetical protein GCM10011357_34490 [Lacimicrobium alkaliphilum]|uniref:Uncharacterized protein n=1 Tax=Lacimicrobium alkaliphilum TaxID=1526571 RepID=A0ABQ1RSG0_9ALTE|nr:hypothetical protein GCM10011357_34490 [Lacimicrobium alkaliphilum]